MEKVFNPIMKKISATDKEVLEIVLNGLKKVQESLIQIAENGQEVDMSIEIDKLEAL